MLYVSKNNIYSEERIMKKTLAIVFALIMTVCCVASCGSKKNDTTDEKEKLYMCTNATFPPYEYYDGEDIIGIDAEIAQKIAEKLGVELIAPVFANTTLDTPVLPPEIFSMAQALDSRSMCYTIDEFLSSFQEV